MKLSWKAGVALVIGGIALGGTLSSFAGEGSERRPGGERGGRPPVRHFISGHMVRSTAVIEGEDGEFKNIRTDAGELTAIDGARLTVKEADGETVEITVNDDTTYGRDHERASRSDLVVGDHVFVHRVNDAVEHVMAISAEQYAEMEAKRAACEDDDDSTECEHRRGPHGRPGGRGGPQRHGDTEPAPGPAMFEEAIEIA